LPGTTRDYIDDCVELGGYLLRIFDTAGVLNKPAGPDRMAQERTLKLFEHSDLVILIFDGSEPMNEQDIYLYSLTKDVSKLFVVNKVDLNLKLNSSEILSDSVKISAKTGQNIKTLIKRIISSLIPRKNTDDAILTRHRHIQIVQSVRSFLNDACTAFTPDTMAFELNSALHTLGELTGQVIKKDILDRIFEEFCIGK
jgi:tRNA modification GTPase